MPNDASVAEQPLNIGVVELSDSFVFEPGKGTTKMLPLAQDGQPAQTRLKTLEADLLEESDVVVNWHTPFVVVIRDVQWVVAAPPTASLAIGMVTQPAVERRRRH